MGAAVSAQTTVAGRWLNEAGRRPDQAIALRSLDSDEKPRAASVSSGGQRSRVQANARPDSDD
jgi:hypothetical protein